MTTGPLNATLIDRQDLTDELCIIRAQPDRGHAPQFEPGQFITLGLPKETASNTHLTRRAYSIASSAKIRDYIELYVVLVESGRFTPRLWDLQVGDPLWMDDKAKGHFTLDSVPSDKKDLIMICTGTGIAPYMSMLRTFRGQSRWNRFVVIHGARLAQDLGYLQQLERICEEDPTVGYVPTVTREPADSPWRGLRGRVQVALQDDTYERLIGAPLDPNRCHIFLCGNPDMIQSLQEDLEARGFVTQTRTQTGNIHIERYW